MTNQATNSKSFIINKDSLSVLKKTYKIIRWQTFFSHSILFMESLDLITIHGTFMIQQKMEKKALVDCFTIQKFLVIQQSI